MRGSPTSATSPPNGRTWPGTRAARHTIPWQWGSTGVAVNTSAYAGDINTSDIFLDPPPELQGKINVVPEMTDIIGLAIMNAGGEPCTEDLEILRQVRDMLVAAKPHWLSHGLRLARPSCRPTTSWRRRPGTAHPCGRGSTTPPWPYGYPVEGYPIWMDSVALLSDAQNVDEAYEFLNFIMAPENAALISNYARYANGIAGSEEFMDPEMATAPEVVIPEEHRANGRLPARPARASATELYSADLDRASELIQEREGGGPHTPARL